jgi:hypothetical protein
MSDSSSSDQPHGETPKSPLSVFLTAVENLTATGSQLDSDAQELGASLDALRIDRTALDESLGTLRVRLEQVRADLLS